MKDTENTVYALNVSNPHEGTLIPGGFLLFLNEQTALNFIALCATMSEKEKVSHYEPHGPVVVNDFTSRMIEQKRSFFVGDLNNVKPE